MSGIKAVEVQRPSGLPGVQSFGRLDEGMIFVVQSHSKRMLIFLQPMFPFVHCQPDPQEVLLHHLKNSGD